MHQWSVAALRQPVRQRSNVAMTEGSGEKWSLVINLNFADRSVGRRQRFVDYFRELKALSFGSLTQAGDRNTGDNELRGDEKMTFPFDLGTSVVASGCSGWLLASLRKKCNATTPKTMSPRTLHSSLSSFACCGCLP